MSLSQRRRKRQNLALAANAVAPAATTGTGRTAVGFWVGGFVLGVTGCVVGACMPYRHPFGVLCSVLWWGVYLGCAGASIVALGCWLTQRQPPVKVRKRSRRPAGAPPALAVLPEEYRDRFTGAGQGGQELRIK
jgi:hypothetical protein